jgi:hypothetical protein
VSSFRDSRERVDQEEIDRLLEEALGPPPTPPPQLTDHALDDILASRTHVRVLRALVALDRGMNLSSGEVARRARASPGRVLQVLRQLSSIGVVSAHRTPTHAIYYLAESHPLIDAVRSLFDEERSMR